MRCMRRLSREVETFLDVVLPQYRMLQQVAADLPALRTPQDNLAAVQKLYPALCKSLRAFEKMTLPMSPRCGCPTNATLSWTTLPSSSLAQLFSEALEKSDRPGLAWPPPGVEADLTRFYALAVARPRSSGRKEMTKQQLTATCRGLRGRACHLSAAALKESSRPDTSSVPALEATATQGSQLVSSLVFLATTAGVLQFPGAVEEFPSDSLHLLGHVRDMAELALTTAQHFARELTQYVTLEVGRPTDVRFKDMGDFSL